MDALTLTILDAFSTRPIRRNKVVATKVHLLFMRLVGHSECIQRRLLLRVVLHAGVVELRTELALKRFNQVKVLRLFEQPRLNVVVLLVAAIVFFLRHNSWPN